MIFRYKAINDQGEQKEGTIDAVNRDLAIGGLQHRGLIVVSIIEEKEKKGFLNITLFESVPLKDVVILSRQISTLFESQVSALKAFSLLSSNTENRLLSSKLSQVTSDLQAGFSISGALEKHPDVFSEFYVNMVKAGEESGKLNQTFAYLADYLDREYALTTKTRNALIYPAFVILVFFAVMTLMFVFVIPKLSALIEEAGQDIPFYTKLLFWLSDFLVNYGIFILIIVAVFAIYIWRLSRTERGEMYLDNLRLSIPVVGNLYKKLYMARIADNFDTMLSAGISIVRSIEITSKVVGSKKYKTILEEAEVDVKAGASLSNSFSKHKEIPQIMVQMVQVGEETGSLPSILKTLGRFYKREVDDAVDTMVGLIEPIMIVVLGIGVAILLVSVLLPIYDIAGSIS